MGNDALAGAPRFGCDEEAIAGSRARRPTPDDAGALRPSRTRTCLVAGRGRPADGSDRPGTALGASAPVVSASEPQKVVTSARPPASQPWQESKRTITVKGSPGGSGLWQRQPSVPVETKARAKAGSRRTTSGGEYGGRASRPAAARRSERRSDSEARTRSPPQAERRRRVLTTMMVRVSSVSCRRGLHPTL